MSYTNLQMHNTVADAFRHESRAGKPPNRLSAKRQAEGQHYDPETGRLLKVGKVPTPKYFGRHLVPTTATVKHGAGAAHAIPLSKGEKRRRAAQRKKAQRNKENGRVLAVAGKAELTNSTPVNVAGRVTIRPDRELRVTIVAPQPVHPTEIRGPSQRGPYGRRCAKKHARHSKGAR